MATCAAVMMPVVDLLLDAVGEGVESGSGRGWSCSLQYGSVPRGCEMADVHVHRVGEVDVITIDRPDVRNALRFQSYDELEAAVRTTTARCLVITGADPAFCSGDDVREVMGGGDGPKPTAVRAAADAGRRRAAAHRTCRSSPRSTARRSAGAWSWR